MPRSGNSFAPFRHRAYLLVWLGALASNIGTWMEVTALSYHVAETADVASSGLVAAAGFLPSALLSPVAGTWADRYSRRRIIVAANLASMMVAAGVAIVVTTDHATPAVLALFSLIGGCTGAIAFPAFQATLPDLVPPEDLVAAIGLSSTQWNLGRIVGPTLAAIAIAIGGVPMALWINAASFGMVILAVSVAAIPRRTPVHRSVMQAIRDGAAFVWSTPGPRAMLPLLIIQVFITAPFIGFVAQMATNVLGHDSTGTSVLLTAQGLGAVIAGTSIGPLSARFGLRRVLVGAIVLSAPALALYGAAPNLATSALALLVLGGCYMASLSASTTVIQQNARPDQRGRAMVVNNFVLGAFYPLGLLLQGELADLSSLRTVTIGAGAALAVVISAAFAVRPDRAAPIGTSVLAPSGATGG